MTNFYGTAEITGAISHLINDNGKIIIIGSLAGTLDILKSEGLKKEFEDPNLTMYKLYLLAQKYYLDIKYNRSIKEGWSKWPYGVSKIFLHTYAISIAADPLYVNRNIQVYIEHPGTVLTEMSQGIPSLLNIPISTLDEGVSGTCYLFDLPWTINEYQGCLFDQCKKASYSEKIDFSQIFKDEEKAFDYETYH